MIENMGLFVCVHVCVWGGGEGAYGLDSRNEKKSMHISTHEFRSTKFYCKRGCFGKLTFNSQNVPLSNPENQ